MYPTTALQPSQTFNPQVVELQKWLVENGFMSQGDIGVGSGYYGPKTTAAVKAAQTKYGISNPTGIWDPSVFKTQSETPETQDGSQTSTPPTGHYGYDPEKPATSYEAREAETLGMLDGKVTGGLAEIADLENIIERKTLDKIASDPMLVAFYVHALTYGGYVAEDIVKDWKRRELVDSGNKEAEDLEIISADMNRSDYLASDDGQKAAEISGRIIPNVNVGSLASMNILQYGLNMPDDLFKKIVPLSDNQSQEYKDAVAQIQSMTFDLAQAQLDASTEQEKSIADYNMKEFQRQVQEKYGIALSDDATKAWAQLEQLTESGVKRGIADSGIQQELIDDTLSAARKTSQKTRQNQLTEEESRKASYYTSSASAAEIAALSPEERQKYGLTPSADVLAKYNFAALKAKYPNESDENIQKKIDAVMTRNPDGSYSYRSTLYRNYYGGTADLSSQKQTFAEGEVDAANKTKIDRAMDSFDRSQPYSDAAKSQSTQTTPTTVGQTTNPSLPGYDDKFKADAYKTHGKSILGMNTTFKWTPDEINQINAGTYGVAAAPKTTQTPQTQGAAPQTQGTAPARSSNTISPNMALPTDFSTNASAYVFDPIKGFVKK